MQGVRQKPHLENLEKGILKTTSKTFWKLLKTIMNKSNTGIPTLNVDGNQVLDDKGKAEAIK